MKNIDDEDYVQHPSYENSNNHLISKLQLRMQLDLNRINSVYDEQITDAEKKKTDALQMLESEYKNNVDEINSKRHADIYSYNMQAEQHIDNLISGDLVNTSQQSTLHFGVIIEWLGSLLTFK